MITAGGETRKQEVLPWIGPLAAHRYVLDNGLKLVVVPDSSSPTFAYQTWYRVGSRDEAIRYTGLAHLFEHMMFKGTKRNPGGQFDKLLEAAGAEGENAFTSRDYTAYVQEMPASSLELIAELEADRMVNLVVDEKSFKTETEVVQNERRFRNENNPDGTMYQAIFEEAFTDHPYHWPVIGYQADLERMHATDALAFYKAHYSPNNATIVIVGDVKPEAALATIQRHYGGLPSQPSPASGRRLDPPQTAPKIKTMPLGIQVEKLLVGYRVPAYLHADMPALDVLQALLAGGKSSRLHLALVNTGIAANVDTFGFEDVDPSLLLVMANLQKGRSANTAEAVILKELAKLTKTGPSEDELKRAKNRLSLQFYEGLESNVERAHFIGHYETIAGRFTAGMDHFNAAMKVSALEVQAVAKRYLAPEARTVIKGVRK